MENTHENIINIVQPSILEPEHFYVLSIDYQITTVYNYIKSIHNQKITSTNIISLTSKLIQIVEKYNSLTGEQKKVLVINVIKRYIDNQVDTEENRQALNLIVDLTLPSVIDNIVSAINGEISFSKIKLFFNKFLCC